MRRILLIGLLLSAVASVALAQDEPTATPPKPSVFVRDSGLAIEKLALAAKLEKQKNWPQAADVYQEVASKYADRVIATRTGADGQPTQYVSASAVVQDRLARWPAEGLAAYRQRFEDTARDLLNAADPADATPAQRVMALYFVTDAGRDAAMWLQSAAFERGDFSDAAYVGRRLLDAHPNVVAERPRVLVQTALAEHFAGRADDAAKDAAELKTRFADTTGTVAGVDAKLLDTLTAALAVAPGATANYRSDDWPSPFGTTEADAVPPVVSQGGAKLFSYELPSGGRRNIPAQRMKDYQQHTAVARQSGLLTGIVPAIDGGDLFFQDNARVYAVSLSSGRPLPGWAATYPGDARGTFSVNALPTPSGKQLTVTVAGDRVVALLGQFDFQAASIGVPSFTPQLVCLDRDTGRRLWSLTPQQKRLNLPDDLAALREGVFYGSPLVSGDTVFVPVHATRGDQFDECYVLAVSLADGAYRWAGYVASTSAGNRFTNFEIGDPSGGGTVAQLSASGGRLYVATNLGAVACMDATDGRVLWLNVYAQLQGVTGVVVRGRFPRPGFFPPQQATAKPFSISPPIIDRGRVFVLPADSHDLLVYDALDGTPQRALNCQFDAKFAPADMLLAVVGDTVVLANRSTLFRVPWRTYDPNKSIVANGGMYKSPPGVDSDNPDKADALRGRPFVSGRDILVTTPDQLHRISLDGFRTVSLYPAQGKWDDEESPGNIVATADHLVIAGPTRVTAYADLGLATAKLDAQIAADAGNVEPYFRYAELMFAANRTADGLARLDAAAERLGGLPALRPGPDRERLFGIALAAAAKLQKADGQEATVGQLYDRAAAAAETPAQQVQYRLSRAAFARRANDAAAELALHQQILFRADWRAAPTPGSAVGSTGGSAAEAAVTELVHGHGDALYAPYETAAATRLATLSAQQPADADALVAVADEYPAFSQAADALSQAAERYEQQRRFRPASQTWQRLLRRDVSNERRLVALQGLARVDLLVPTQTLTARARLRDAAALAPSAKLMTPLTLPDGRQVGGTVAEALDAVTAYAAGAPQAALPTLGTPPTSGGRNGSRPAFKPAEAVADVSGLVRQQADLARYDRLVTVGLDRSVGVVDTATARLTRTDATLDDAALGCGFTGDHGGTLVVLTAGRLVALDAAGKTVFSLDAGGLPRSEAVTAVAEPSADDEDEDGDRPLIQARIEQRRRMLARRARRGLPFPVMPVQAVVDAASAVGDAANPAERFLPQFRVLSDRVVLATTAGRLLAVDLAGHTLWQTRLGDQPATRMAGNDDFVACLFGDPGGTSDVYAVDAVTGRPVLHRTFDGNTNPQGGSLVNLAVSPDGVLVMLLNQRVLSHDLYDASSPDADAHADLTARMNPNDPPFKLADGDGEGQLVVTDDTVLAVYHAAGTNAASVWAYGLRSMKPLSVNDDRQHRSVQVTFGPRSNEKDDLGVTVVASGPSVYVVGQHALAGYRLDYPTGAGWQQQAGAGDRGLGVGLLLARDLAVLVTQQGMNNPAATRLTAIRLYIYDRTPLPDQGRENGMLEQYPILREPAAGFLAGQWQLADHAFYYVTGDQKLKLLRASDQAG